MLHMEVSDVISGQGVLPMYNWMLRSLMRIETESEPTWNYSTDIGDNPWKVNDGLVSCCYSLGSGI